MICPKYGKESAEILVDYCAQTLDSARAAEFEKHIEACSECRRLVEAQRDVWETLNRWTPAPVSSDFDARLYARIAQEEASPHWIQWWRRAWKPSVSLAAVCAVLVLAFLVHLPAPRDTAKQIRPDKVDIEQVEQTLEDLDILSPAT